MQVLKSMNIVDWIIVFGLVTAFIVGYVRGFIKQAITLLGFVISFFVAYKYHHLLAPVLEKTFPIVHDDSSVPVLVAQMLDIDTVFYRAVSFGLLFFGCKLILLGIGAAAHALSLIPGIGAINRWLGGALSVVEIALILYIAVQISLVMPWPKVHAALDQSTVHQWTKEHTRGLSDKLLEWWSKGEKDEEPNEKL